MRLKGLILWRVAEKVDARNTAERGCLSLVTQKQSLAACFNRQRHCCRKPNFSTITRSGAATPPRQTKEKIMDIKLKSLEQEYMGRCNIIPCCDLPKIEGSFNDLKDDIIDSFVNQNIISNWTLKDEILEKYNDNEEFDNDDEREENFWNEVVCRCLNKGYLVIYELPVPNGIHKNNEKIEYFSCSWGYFQTHFIHITDLAQLTSVLSNLDDMIIKEKYKEEQQKKEK